MSLHTRTAMRICFLSFLFLFTLPAFALQPLVTDDIITQGKGVFQLAFNYQYIHDKYVETKRDPRELVESEIAGQSSFGRLRVKEDTNQSGISFAYGLIDQLDIGVGIPYQHVYTRERHLYYTGPLQGFRLRDSETATGLSDVTLEIKWKFYEFKAMSLGFKPGLTVPAGDHEKGLGAGRLGGFGYFIATFDFTSLLMHINLGYIRNQNRINEREDIWHASVAWEVWLARDILRFAANAGIERNRDKRSNVHDAFLVAGFIGSPTQDCDLDIGFKYSIKSGRWDSPGPDYSVIAGATIWFGWTPKDKKIEDKKDRGDEKKGA